MTDRGGVLPGEAEVPGVLFRLVSVFLGVLPDDVVVEARQLAAGGDVEDALEVLTFGLVRGQVPVTDVERGLLDSLRVELGLDPAVVEGLPQAGGERPPLYLVDAGPGADPADAARVVASAADREVLDALPLVPAGAIGVWRGWRYPFTRASWPPPRPVYVVEVATDDGVRSIMQAWYRGDRPGHPGPDGPLVEAYVSGEPVPELVRQVQDEGVLVHVAGGRPRFRTADALEVPPASGAVAFLPRLEAAEAARLADRLDRGPVIVTRGPHLDDVLDPGRVEAVPRSVRTDGRWLWTEESAYYLREHRIAPPEPFLSYLRERVDEVPVVPDTVIALGQLWWERHGLPERRVRPPAGPAGVPAALHRLLLHLEDSLSDGVAARCRRGLALGEVPGTASWLGTIAIQGDVALRPDELDLLAGCLAAVGDGERAGAVRRLGPVRHRTPTARVRFDAGTDAEARAAQDGLVLGLLGRVPAVLGVWRAWRYPLVAAGQDPARPVFLVECDGDQGVSAVLAAWYGRSGPYGPAGDPLVARFGSGDDRALVVPFAAGDHHPQWHADLVEAGQLVHAGWVPERLHVASLVIDDEAPRLGEQEAAALVARLAAGRVFGRADEAAAAVLADGRAPGVRVPLTLRTDGRWVWSDAAAYYLSRYGVPPDAALLAYLRGTGAPPAPVPEVAGALAARALRVVGGGLADGAEGVPGVLLAPPPPQLPALDRRQARRRLHELVRGLVDVLADADADALARLLAADRLEEAVAALGRAMTALSHVTVRREQLLLDDCRAALGVDAPPGPLPVQVGERQPRAVVVPAAPDDGTAAAVDAAVLPVLRGADGVLGVWRGWRRPDPADAGRQALRAVYLVELRDLDALLALETTLHGPGAPPSGPGGALVQTYVDVEVPPPLLRALCEQGEPVHVGVPEPGFRLAPSRATTGYAGLGGPPEPRPVLSEADAVDAVAYLRSGRVVSTGVYTDGRWIWPEELADDVDRTRAGLPAQLAAYLRTQPRLPRHPSDTVVALARRWLRSHGPVAP